MKKFYITTPIYYVNDVPHIGHAYTTIAADVLARWKRLSGQPTFFLTGTDEHGAKIAQVAEAAKISPQQLVDQVSRKFSDLWTTLTISNDDFIRTSEERHVKVVQAIFETLKKKGDIYKGFYEDWYCLSDETYFSEADLVDKKCPQCGRDVNKLKEESYFFKLSKYEKPLLDFYAAHPAFLSPKNRANEIINFVKSGLRDLSVSRSRVKWGVPVPSDPAHVVYVWFDALINYVTAAGFKAERGSSKPDFADLWPADVHLVGKEIFRFHAVIWPAMLMALELPLPLKVFAHGWWTVEGTKMSKSLGNVVDPHTMVAEYGVDPFRYFLFREVPFGSDGDFSEKSLLGRYNSELANNLGNLVQRSVTILVKNFDGVIPVTSHTSVLMGDGKAWVAGIRRDFEALAFGDVLESAFSLMIKTNKFIDEKAPWKLGIDQKKELAQVLVECVAVLKVLSVVLSPFMPTKMQELWVGLGEKGLIEQEGGALLAALEREPAFSISFEAGQTVKKGDPLFMRKGGRWK